MLLVAGSSGRGDGDQSAPSGRAGEVIDPPSAHRETDGNETEDLETEDVQEGMEEFLDSVEDLRREIRQAFGPDDYLLDVVSSALDKALNEFGSPNDDDDCDDGDREDTASRDRQIAMLLDCQGAAYDLADAAGQLYKLGAVEQAMAMMTRAESECEDALDWLRCAEFWVERDDKSAVSRCLEAAEDTDMDGEQSVWAAGLWARLGADRDRQIQVLFVDDGSGYSIADRAEALIDMEETKLARDLLHKAETRCDDAFDWVRCAKAWKKLKDRESVRRCLDQAEKADPDGDDMQSMSELWDYLGTSDDQRVALLMSDMRSAYDVLERVEALLKLGAPDNARELIGKAEAFCDDASQWLCCARAWNRLGNDQATRACLEKAEEEGMDWEEIESALELWKELGASREQQIALIRTCTGSGYSASGAARALHEMDEPAVARELMALAEAKSDEGLDWLFCAEAWFDIGDTDACERCLAKSQSYSLDGEETEMAVELREKLDRKN